MDVNDRMRQNRARKEAWRKAGGAAPGSYRDFSRPFTAVARTAFAGRKLSDNDGTICEHGRVVALEKKRVSDFGSRCEKCNAGLTPHRTEATRADQAGPRYPEWAKTFEDRRARRAFYREAGDLTALTGTAHAVDHVIPLHGELVSGLHVAANLQVLTHAANCEKGNRFEP